MTKEELVRQAEKRVSYNITTVKEEKAFIEGFVRGAEWMQAQMQDTNEGKALLYAVHKTAERTKREMIRKAKMYLQEKLYTTPIFEYDEDEEPIMYVCASCCDSVEEFISDFKQAMEEGV